MVMLNVVLVIVFFLKVFAIIFVIGLLSGFASGIGDTAKGIAEFVFNAGQEFGEYISNKVRKGQNANNKK